MRIALARALFIKPHLLLLDEPTNHLDLEACVWLEEELRNYKQILVIISHSQDFMNGVCTNVMHLDKQKLQYYGGNYDAFVRTRLELLENQAKRYQWEQDQIAHMKVKCFECDKEMMRLISRNFFRTTLPDLVMAVPNWLDKLSPRKKLLPKWWLVV